MKKIFEAFFIKKNKKEKSISVTPFDFEKELLPYTTDGKINVITIDGIKAEKW